MITKHYASREEWLNDKLGKASGSRAKDVMPDAKGNWKKGFWELVDERLRGSIAINSEENPMDRGTRLEPQALARFTQETGKKVDASLLAWFREDDPSIMLSPDGVVGKSAAVEVKCLVGPSHAEALYTEAIPKNTGGYLEQAMQYFVVNDKLKTLYFVFYNPDYPPGLDYFCLTFQRKDYKTAIASQLAQELQVLRGVREVTNKLMARVVSFVPSDSLTLDNIKKHIPSEAAPTLVLSEEQIQLVNENAKSGLDRVYRGIKERAYD